MNNLNKDDVVSKIAEEADISKSAAKRALDAFIDTVKDSLVDDDKITLVGFGTFLVKIREARDGRNPQTGETIHIPKSRVPTFKPGKAFKDALNEDTQN